MRIKYFFRKILFSCFTLNNRNYKLCNAARAELLNYIYWVLNQQKNYEINYLLVLNFNRLSNYKKSIIMNQTIYYLIIFR